MTRTSLIRFTPTLFLLAHISCTSDDPTGQNHNEIDRIPCTVTADCAIRGGECVGGECVASNECATDADCPAGEVCTADTNFGGLCGPPGATPVPGPVWSCATGKDCPAGQGCGSDDLCHVDGECDDTTPCAGAGQFCYNAGNDVPDGICTDERPDNDPTCRSDGLGACRSECNSDGTCWDGSCVNGFCHPSDECLVDADCTPNHICVPWSETEDYGYSRCAEDPNPPCFDDGMGACRLACLTDLDCIHGGGCDPTDMRCHASNECTTNADCDPGLECWPDPEFGGLCGPPRP